MTSTSGGAFTTTLTYDLNGNLLAGASRTIAYTSFNKPATITEGTKTLTFTHDVDHQRFKQVSPEGTTLYLAAFGIMVEKFSGSGGLVRWNEYIFGSKGMVAERFNVTSAPTSVTTRYFHLDSLGSIAVITDEAGVVPSDGRQSYDAWGKRRFPNGADDTTGSIASETTRGFTGHEELDDVGLVHMNGRVYDPMLGRFTSADPTVQQPFNSQGWNRYAYIQNNPLAFTDPNGYGFFSFLSHIFNPIQILQDHVSILRAVYSVPYLGQALNAVTAAAVTYFTGGCVPCGVGAYSALSSLQAGVTSGNLGEAFKAGVISGAQAFASYYGGFVGGGLVGGAISSAEGGSFKSGFLVAGFSSLANVVPNLGFVGNIIVSAAISGTAAVIGGGKFETGAINGAIGAFVNGAATRAFAYSAGLNNGAPGDGGGGPTLSHAGDGATAFVGGFFDHTIEGAAYSEYLDYIKNNPEAGAAYFTWDQGGALGSWIDAHGGAVTVSGHSWGGDTAASVVAAGHGVNSLITVDPVSWFRPDYAAVAANAGTWTNFNATGGAGSVPNLIAGIGGAWGTGPLGFATRFRNVNTDHATIGFRCMAPGQC